MNVLALDLSLTATGVAHCDGTAETWSPKSTGPARLKEFRELVTDLVADGFAVDLVAIEGYSFSSRNSQAHSLGELGGVVRLALHDIGVPWVAIPPANVKKYATGKGNATKPDMRMALFQRFGVDERDDNRVDARWLRAMALDHFGHPLVVMPQVNREALDKVTWPELVVAR